jgi:homoserine O-acetyltransferase
MTERIRISVLMADPNWNNGSYYDGLPPHTGMKLARQIATITYRSGPEWDQRFGRNLRKLSDGEQAQLQAAGQKRRPALCPDFLIETYLDHQVSPNQPHRVSVELTNLPIG